MLGLLWKRSSHSELCILQGPEVNRKMDSANSNCSSSSSNNSNEAGYGGSSCTMDSPSTHSSRITITWRGHLYDVTDFASRHPGGRELLEKHNGKDVETLMQDRDSHVHSKAAYTILAKYRVPQQEQPRCLSEGSTQQNGEPSVLSNEATSDDFDGYVDWSKPLLTQVEELGERYYEWTHHQVDRPIRLFQSDAAELMTKCHWWMVPLVWCPVVVAMLMSSYRQLTSQPETWPQKNIITRQYGPASIPLLVCFGILFWTLLEYVIHRWLFHLKPPASSRFLIRLHFSLHGQHHKSPMDPMRLVFPPLPASFFAVIFYLGTHLIFPSGMAQSVFSGIVLGYMAYDLTHYYIHHGGTPMIPYFRRLKTYHTLHHYQHQQLGFGISSKLWDYPFGTLIPEDLKSKKSS